MTRLLVAGLGLIGARHAALVRDHPSFVLAGVIDPDAAARARWDVPGFDDIADVDVSADGVIIATPTHLHARHAAQAAARGWGLLIEKPVADNRDDCAAILDATHDVPTLVGHHRRHHPRVRRLADLIAGGAIGTPVTASLIWAVKKPAPYFEVDWRKGRAGSPILINLVHDVDLLRHLFGEVTHVSGHGRNADGRIQSGAVALGFDSGVSATIAFADTTPVPWGFEAGTGENPNIGTTGQDMLWITGTGGGVSFPSLTLWGGAADWSEAARPTTVAAPEGTPLVAQLEHFADVIAGRVRPLIDARDGAATLDATLRIEAALSATDPSHAEGRLQ